jgi:hypothetical protein
MIERQFAAEVVNILNGPGGLVERRRRLIRLHEDYWLLNGKNPPRCITEVANWILARSEIITDADLAMVRCCLDESLRRPAA